MFEFSSRATAVAVIAAVSVASLLLACPALAKNEALVWDNYPGATYGGKPVRQDLSRWLDPGATKLIGNNVHVCADLGIPSDCRKAEEIGSVNGDWVFPRISVDSPKGNCPPTGCSWNHLVPFSWRTNLNQIATQAFYSTNRAHDYFAELLGHEILEGEKRVRVSIAAGANTQAGLPEARFTNDALTEPRSIVIHLFQPTPKHPDFMDVDFTDDIGGMVHEYTHAVLSEIADLGFGNQRWAIEEALGDWFEMNYRLREGLIEKSESPHLIHGQYVSGGKGVRTMPMDCSVGARANVCAKSNSESGATGGYTYADFGQIHRDKKPEAHADGEILAQTLMDLRRRLISMLGEQAGAKKTESLIIRAVEKSEITSFLDLRDGLLTVSGDPELTKAIWEVFALRGMGIDAKASGASATDAPPIAGFKTP